MTETERENEYEKDSENCEEVIYSIDSSSIISVVRVRALHTHRMSRERERKKSNTDYCYHRHTRPHINDLNSVSCTFSLSLFFISFTHTQMKYFLKFVQIVFIPNIARPFSASHPEEITQANTHMYAQHTSLYQIPL